MECCPAPFQQAPSPAGSEDRLHLSYATRFSAVRVNVGTTRTFGYYNDLASTVRHYDCRDRRAGAARSIGSPSACRLPFGRNSSVSASFVHAEDGEGVQSDIVSASWSRALSSAASIFATAFADFGDEPR